MYTLSCCLQFHAFQPYCCHTSVATPCECWSLPGIPSALSLPPSSFSSSLVARPVSKFSLPHRFIAPWVGQTAPSSAYTHCRSTHKCDIHTHTGLPCPAWHCHIKRREEGCCRLQRDGNGVWLMPVLGVGQAMHAMSKTRDVARCSPRHLAAQARVYMPPLANTCLRWAWRRGFLAPAAAACGPPCWPWRFLGPCSALRLSWEACLVLDLPTKLGRSLRWRGWLA